MHRKKPSSYRAVRYFLKFPSDSMWLLIILQNTVFSTGDKCIFKCFCYLVKTLNGARARLVIWAIILSVLIINSATFQGKLRALQPTCSPS